MKQKSKKQAIWYWCKMGFVFAIVHALIFLRWNYCSAFVHNWKKLERFSRKVKSSSKYRIRRAGVRQKLKVSKLGLLLSSRHSNIATNTFEKVVVNFSSAVLKSVKKGLDAKFDATAFFLKHRDHIWNFILSIWRISIFSNFCFIKHC